MEREETPVSRIITIYEKGEYIAQVHTRSDIVVVCRNYKIGDRIASTHVGEKHPSEDWREVRLRGCPDDIRKDIIDAHTMFKCDF